MKLSQSLQFLPMGFFLLGPSIGHPLDLMRKEMPSGNFEREYFVHLPSTYRNSQSAPVVLVFHGGGGNAQQIAKFSGFNEISEENGFLVIYPEAIDKHWNDGRQSEKFQEHDEKVNDVAWIAALITELQTTYSVDYNRIYAVGISNGGIFSQRLALELSKHFAAVASLTAQIAEPLPSTQPTNPISVLLINGTKDPFVPYDGGEITPRLFPRFGKMLKQPSRGKVISTDSTIEFWLQHNGIDPKGLLTKIPDRDTTDGSSVERREWTHSKIGVSVLLYKIIGGGHTWPGRRQYLPVQTVGQTNRDINASERVWEFFSQHPKNN